MENSLTPNITADDVEIEKHVALTCVPSCHYVQIMIARILEDPH